MDFSELHPDEQGGPADTPKITPREAVGGTANTWGPRDEAKFAEMQARRERVLALRMSYLEMAMAGAQGIDNHDRLLAYMIDNAGAIRDALAPYDNRS